jgi:hypothetical protein
MKISATLATAAALAVCTPLSAQADDGYAAVSANGNVVRGDDVRSARRVRRGEYIVRFEDGVRPCGYFATVGLPGTGTPPAGVASVARGADRTEVRVVIRALGGGRVDRPFHLAVVCSDD